MFLRRPPLPPFPPGAVLVVGVDLWRPSRETQMRQLYGALPATRLDVLAARYLLLAVGWVILRDPLGPAHYVAAAALVGAATFLETFAGILHGAPVLGMVFGIGMSPCIGPVYGAIQVAASPLSNDGAPVLRGVLLAAGYSLGLGLPFVLIAAGIMFVVLMFILMQREDLRDRLIRLAGSNDLHRTTVAMDDAARRLSRYFVVQVGLNAAFGLVIGVGLYFIGVPNPVLWGIFSALMRFVPYLGAVLSALLPMALAAAVDPGWNMMIAVAILFVVLEPLTGQVFEPIFYGQSTGLSPTAVLVSALFWTWLWGPVGLLLSTPLTACLVVLGRHVERLWFLDVILGDVQCRDLVLPRRDQDDSAG